MTGCVDQHLLWYDGLDGLKGLLSLVLVCLFLSINTANTGWLKPQEFGEVLEKYAVEMEQYHTKNEMVKRDQLATEVCWLVW